MHRALPLLLLAVTLAPPSAAQATKPGSDLPDSPSQSRRASAAADRKPQAAVRRELTVRSPYEPLTDRQKFNRFLRHTVSPYTFASAAMSATWLQINGEPRAYGGGMQGWGKRLGAGLADAEARTFFSQYFFPTILNQDPRYFAKREGTVFNRGWYAATRVLVGRNDAGDSVFNSSYLLSVAATRALANAYIPAEKRTFETTMLAIVGAYGSDAGSLVLREFWPDIMRVFRRHAPERLKKIQEKIPPEILGTPRAEQSDTSDRNAPPDKSCDPGKCEPERQ
jgi:hypothetical protein